jgi:hypothetical protein
MASHPRLQPFDPLGTVGHRRISSTDWAKYHGEIRHLYMEEDWSVRRLVEHFEKAHSLKVTYVVCRLSRSSLA